MRSMKKLLKKAMVFTLTAAMLVGTPLTASAAPLNSVYSVGDHWGGQYDDGDDTSHTGTVSNTATNTNTGVLKDNETRILGIALDKTHLDVEVEGEQETITATILTDADAGELEDKYGNEAAEQVMKELVKMIRWEVQNYDGNVDGTTNKRLSIRVTTKGDGSQITLNPRMGTEEGKDMIVKASIDGSYAIRPGEDGKVTVEKLVTNKTEGLSAKATVSIKEYSRSLSWKDGKTETETWVKHTVDLGEKLKRDPETANDTITWTSTNTKFATVNAKGVVTIKNVKAADLPAECKIIAMGEHKDAKTTRTLKITAGTPAYGVYIFEETSDGYNNVSKQTISLDVNDTTKKELLGQRTVKVKAVKVGSTYAKTLEEADSVQKADGTYPTINVEFSAGVDQGDYVEITDKANKEIALKRTKELVCTDVISWSSNKPSVATVTSRGDGGSAMVTLVGVGKAKITAKTTSGKSTYTNIEVTADLKKLKIKGIDNGQTLYSGETRTLTAERTPKQNNDKLKWQIAKVTKKGASTLINNPNAKINNKGVLTIQNKINTDYPEVTVELIRAANTEKGLDEIKESVTINVAQSSINGITVVDQSSDETPEVAKLIYKDFTSSTKAAETKNQTVDIKVPLNHSFKATVDVGYGMPAGTNLDVLANTLTWTASGKSVEISGETGGEKKITAKAAGTSTITVTGIRATSKVQGGETVLKSAGKISVKFKISVVQPVETITMNKPAITMAYQPKSKTDANPKSLNASLKVTLGPKGVKTNKEKITWSVTKTHGVDDGTAVPQIKVSGQNVPTNKLSAKFKLMAPVAGDEYVVTAKSSTGVVATSTIKIVQKTTGVEISESNVLTDNAPVPVQYTPAGKTSPVKNKTEIDIGDDLQLYSFVNVGADAKNNKNWKLAGSENTIEGVTYSVNKKGIVSIDSQGHVVGLAKGTVKITAKTPMGKSKAITVVVNVPAD